MANVVTRCRVLEEFDRTFSSAAKEKLGIDCRVMNLVDGCLVLGVDNGALATRLRYQTQQLLAVANAHLTEPVNRIKIRVLPTPANPVDHGEAPQISAAARAHLARAAAAERDPKLREILLHLAGQDRNPQADGDAD